MFKGILTENYVACELYPKSKELYYYTFDKYEINFLNKKLTFYDKQNVYV